MTQPKKSYPVLAVIAVALLIGVLVLSAAVGEGSTGPSRCEAMYQQTDADEASDLADTLDVKATDLGYLSEQEYVSKCERLGWDK